jgi:hypothetical protein
MRLLGANFAGTGSRAGAFISHSRLGEEKARAVARSAGPIDGSRAPTLILNATSDNIRNIQASNLRRQRKIGKRRIE